METVGFIGLGHLGNRMSRRVLGSGYAVVAYDVKPEALARLVQAGLYERWREVKNQAGSRELPPLLAM